MSVLPDTPAQAKARADHAAACRRLAEAATALAAAQSERDAAQIEYNQTWGAAKQAGVL